MACTTPTRSSTSSEATGKREWPLEWISSRIVSGESASEIQATSGRGTMMERTLRSAMRSTPSIISRSFSSKTPDSVPSAIIALTSSSVTAFSPFSLAPTSLPTVSVDTRRNQTMGAPMVASARIGVETKQAIPSGLASAKRFGTSSPRISEK